MTPRPASPHARAASVLAADLGGPFDRPPGDPAALGGWWLLFEPELHLKSDEIVPRTKGLLMAYELLDMAQARWRRLDGAHLLPPVRAGILFVDGVQ